MISDVESAAAWRDELAADGRQAVFTNGCFDLLHVGHVRYLQQARALGDALVIGLNSDASVRALKGEGRPINSAADRAEVLAALSCVDRVVEFEGERATGLIEAIRPQIYAKGGDYTAETLNSEERGALDAVGARIEILDLVAGKSTTDTIAAMQEGGARPFRIGVLGSGTGRNLESIFAQIEDGRLEEVEVAIVISDVEAAPILERTRKRGVEAVYVNPGEHPNRLSMPAQKEITDRLRAAGVDLVVCAGFLKLLKEPILSAFEGRIINIHPSLLPKHKGLEAWAQALAAGDSEAGCSVHHVTADVDAGAVIAQAKVAVRSDDSPDALYQRIQEQEHLLLPQVIGELARQSF